MPWDQWSRLLWLGMLPETCDAHITCSSCRAWQCTSKEPCSLRALMKTGSRAGDSFWALSTTTTPPGQSLRKPESSFCTAPAASGLLCADCPACMMGDELNLIAFAERSDCDMAEAICCCKTEMCLEEEAS